MSRETAGEAVGKTNHVAFELVPEQHYLLDHGGHYKQVN
jgi:hypothetical protein